MADIVGQQLGKYRLQRRLGQGGFAEVYLGEHIYLKTQAAIKVLKLRLASDDQESFFTEARTIAALKHPNIVRVLDFGVEDNTPFLVMDYAPSNLRQLHPRSTSVPLNVVVHYVKQVAAALQYAHDRRIIHRDIKPENMLVGPGNKVLLSDFGLAVVAQSQTSPNLEKRNTAGTMTYMSPEQIQGKPRTASDQYALGIVVYEWLCGKSPFQGNFAELAVQHMFNPPPAIREQVPTVSRDVEQVVLRALAKDPQQRFASIMDFANALEQASRASGSLPATFHDVSPTFLPLSFVADKGTGSETTPHSEAFGTEVLSESEVESVEIIAQTPTVQLDAISHAPTVPLDPMPQAQASSLSSPGAIDSSLSQYDTIDSLPSPLLDFVQFAVRNRQPVAVWLNQSVVLNRHRGEKPMSEKSIRPRDADAR